MAEETAPLNCITSEPQQYSIVFISYSHTKPSLPSPDLSFDLRKIPNPPKHIRDAYDGRSKRLREHMLADGEFVRLLEAAQERVSGEMTRMAGEADGTEGTEQATSASLQVKDATGVEENGNGRQLVVSCFCERGKHRSVAFAEELARVKWPSEWNVQVYHRDIDGSARKKQLSRKGRKQEVQDAFVLEEG